MLAIKSLDIKRKHLQKTISQHIAKQLQYFEQQLNTRSLVFLKILSSKR